MRLNKKGIESFNTQVVEIALNDPESYSKDKALEMIEFKPDDFEDTVCLTLKEAKEIAVTMFAYHELCQKFLIGDDNFVIKSSKISHILDKRIDQVEQYYK